VAAPAPKSHQTVLVVVAACVALVAIVAIVFIVNRTGSVAHKSEPSGGSSSITVASTPAPPEAGKPRAQTEAFTQPATVTPPAGSQPPADTSQYKITGIMKDPQGKYCAVINGRVVYVEHYIDGAVVKAIERDRVTLDIGGREAVIRLF
jgi:archaellin